MKKVLDILPHRYPFLLIDKVLDIVPNKSVRAVKNVSNNEPWAQGHYHENPIYPGALIMETMAQASVFIISDDFEEGNKNYGYLCLIDKLKFLKPVYPGDVLIIDATIISYVSDYLKVECKCFVDDELVAKGVISYVIRGEL